MFDSVWFLFFNSLTAGNVFENLNAQKKKYLNHQTHVNLQESHRHGDRAGTEHPVRAVA